MTRRQWLAEGGGLAAAAGGAVKAAPRLRISRFDITSVRVPFHERVRDAWIRSWEHQKRDQRDYVLHFIRLYTDEGLVGIGEAKMPRAEAEARLKSMIGKSPWDYLLDDDLRGILIAVYDLVGKAVQKPVARVLSEQARSAIVPTWWSQCFPPAVMASEAKLAVQLGYRVHKVKARPWEDPIRQAEAMCSVVPKDFKIWVDANGTWETVERTLDVTRQLSRFSNYFAIETPVARGAIELYRKMKGRLALRVSEHVDNIDVEAWTREGLLDAWIVGAPRLGQRLKRLTELAAASRRPIWIEHSIDNGIAQVFQAHQAAAWPSIEYCISVTHVLEDDCMLDPFSVHDGLYRIPVKPGLGVSLDENAIDRYRIA
jgi:L-alanine-DL-glutamate epimerase-like enolase superfamily enzyme